MNRVGFRNSANANVSGYCKDCKKRYVGCHDKCPLYNKYKQDIEDYKAKEKATKDKERLGIF